MPKVLTRVDPDDSVEKLQSDYDRAMQAGHKIALDVLAAHRLAAERSRLERKVLEAVKVAWIDGLISSTTLNDAVKALVEFEAKQETK